MATPTTILQFALKTRNADSAARASMQAALQSAQAALTAARGDVTTATAALAAKEREIAAKRVEVAAADTPGEGAALLAELAALQGEQRALQAQLIEANDVVAEAEGPATLSAAGLARISARLAEAEAELVAATAGDALRSGWKTAATSPPVDQVPGDSTAALAAAAFTTAQTRFDDEIPAKLRAAARKGLEVEAARLERLELSSEAAEDLLMAELEENGGAVGLVARRRMELERAERALRDWTEQARTRYDRAIALIGTVNEGATILNPSEHAGVEALNATAGRDAADLRIALAAAQGVVHDAELDLEEAKYTALADDPTADVATVPAVVTAQGALDDAVSDLGDARDAYDAAAGDFTAWTAEIPDPAWRKVLAFLEADTDLQELSQTQPADLTALVDAVTTAEANLAAALDAAETHAYTVALLEDYVTLREDRVTRFSATYPARLLSAVRGDA
jgi:hypothetical protein